VQHRPPTTTTPGATRCPPDSLDPTWAEGIQLGDLVHLGQRLYDPTTGRFLTPEPAGNLEQPWSTVYAYSQNQPTVRTDPTGNDSTFAWNIRQQDQTSSLYRSLERAAWKIVEATGHEWAGSTLGTTLKYLGVRTSTARSIAGGVGLAYDLITGPILGAYQDGQNGVSTVDAANSYARGMVQAGVSGLACIAGGAVFGAIGCGVASTAAGYVTDVALDVLENASYEFGYHTVAPAISGIKSIFGF
jgi:RHS repeat-associated protein